MTTDYDALVERLGTSPNHLGCYCQTGRDAAQAITTLRAELEGANQTREHHETVANTLRERAEALEHVIKTVTEDHKIQVARAEAAQKEVTDLALRNAELALKLLAAEKELKR